MKKYFVFLVCGMLMFPAVIFAKDGKDTLSISTSVLLSKGLNTSNSIGLTNYKTVNSKKSWFKAMRYTGWARFYPLYRNMESYYDVAHIPGITTLTNPVNLTANDGYQQPLMLFRLEANPSAKTWLQTELQFDNFFKRTSNLTDTTGKLANLYVIFQLQGSVDTRFGKLKMIAGGGSNWYRLSPSTLWGYQYRDDLFERYPWDPEGHDFSRYNSAYSIGDIPRDQRFGMQATQGFILEGTNLPEGFDAALLYGKTTTSGGFQSYLTKSPQNMFASRIGKVLGNHKVGFNYFNQSGYTDNKIDYQQEVRGIDTFYVKDNYVSQLVTSFDGRFDFKYFGLYTELGVGSFLSNTYNSGLKEGAKTGVKNASRYKRDWDETIFFEITTKKKLTRIPLKFSYYRIGALVVNSNSSVANTSVEQAKANPDVPDEYNINYYDGMVTDIGQLANNRQGGNFSVNKKIGKLTTKLDLGIAQELINLAGDIRNGARAGAVGGPLVDSLATVPYTNSITYEHRLNGLTRSRFDFSRRFSGPYQRLHSTFRRTFENIAITDTLIDYKKSFSSVNLELKYKLRLLGKELILSNFNNFSSVQDKWSPIPVFTDKAFVRIFYGELMAFYAIHQKITLVSFGGIERVWGNNRTELADANGNLVVDSTNNRPIASPNGKPVKQKGYGYGIGFDYNFHSRASLHMRNRWFSHEDENFVLDKFKGYESTIEFKVFF